MEEIDPTTAMLGLISQANANVRSFGLGSAYAALLPLSLMVDAKLITVDQAISRAESFKAMLAAKNEAGGVAIIEAILGELRHHATRDPDAPKWTPVVIEGGLASDQDET